MLIRAIIQNFRSIGNELVFDMLPAPSKKVYPHHVYQDRKIRILRTGALYGANGAGKSNIFKALSMLQALATGEDTVPRSTGNLVNKLGKDTVSAPVHIEVEFSNEGKYLAYSLSFKDGIILEEALYELGFDKEDTPVFERKYDAQKGKYSISASKKHFADKKDSMLIDVLADNILTPDCTLLSKAAMLKKPVTDAAYGWFRDKLFIVFPKSIFAPLVSALYDEKFKTFSNNLLRSYDTGIEHLEVVKMPLEEFGLDKSLLSQIEASLASNPGSRFILSEDGSTAAVIDGETVALKPQSYHLDDSSHEIGFDILDESDGSKRLMQYLPIFDRLLYHDSTIFVDEIESSIHPSLLKAILAKLLSPQTQIQGQLIFSTHECNLLDLSIFRQDEIWFVQKDGGRTTVYPLTDFAPRADLDIEKGYLNGRFGAVPFLGNLNDLNWRTEDGKD